MYLFIIVIIFFTSVQVPETQDISDSLDDDFVVTDSAEAVEVAIVESAVQPVREEQLVSRN